MGTILVEKGFEEQDNDDPQDLLSSPPLVQTEFDPAPTVSEPIHTQPSPKRPRDDEKVDKISSRVRRRSARLENIAKQAIEKAIIFEDIFSAMSNRPRTRSAQGKTLESTPQPKFEVAEFQDQAEMEEDESNQVVSLDSPGLISSKL